MGLVVHSSNNLEPPLSTSDERIFVVPPHGKVVVKSRDFKLIYFLKASGRLCIDDKYAFDLKDGDLIVFPNPCEHFYINNSPNSIAQIHAFRLVLQAKDEISRLPDNSEKTFCLENFTEPRQVSALHSPGIIDSINLIRRELEEQATGWTLAVNSAAFQFLVSAARALQSGNLSPEERKAPARFLIVNNAREFIHKNYHRPITLGETALHVGWGRNILPASSKKRWALLFFSIFAKPASMQPLV